MTIAMRFILPTVALSILTLSVWADDGENSAARPFDLQGYIDQKINVGEKRIVIPPGKYRVTPKKRMHLRLERLKNIEIIADGVEMICTETTRGVTIDQCQNLTLTGLVIDYDPLPFTQGEIVQISEDKLTHEIKIFSGYPTTGKITGKKYEIFKPDTRILRFGSYHGCEVTRTTSGNLRITKPARWKNKGNEQVGDIIAIACTHAPGGSIPHALSITNSDQVTLNSVTIYSSAVFGFIENSCSSNTYRNCVVDRRPISNDIKTRASARVRSLNADAFHSYNATKGPAYIQCRARFQGDDCIAINGEYHMVMTSEGKNLRVIARRNFNMEVGDIAEVLSYNGQRLPDARVTAVRPDKKITPGERAFLLKQKMHAGFKTSMHKAYLVTLDRKVQLPKGSLICSSNRLGNGFKIIDGNFGFTRSRGLLIQAGDGVISGNKIDGCHGEAIKVEPEFWWLAAGCAKKLNIQNNIIKNSLKTAIKVSARGGTHQLSPAGSHQNIRISENQIINSPTPQIYVTSTDGVVITKNQFHPHVETTSSPAVVTKNCQKVTEENNTVEPPRR